MSQQIMLEVVTPHRLEFQKEVEYVVAPTVDGIVGVLPGHIRLITQLATGVLRYKIDGQNNYMAVSEGFMEVTPHKVIILAEAADLPEDVDAEQALEEKRQAEEALHHSFTEKINFDQAEIALKRAATKVELAKKYGENK
ncbi:MAG TPA: ATP synthase F1 subunit epsilon [Firmicutes bacterium]|jgi:F-type H+-transporting ATPase subunit epsilon|nr:ATP synthase F1 subunit epsilon [Bacillota bacterium]